MTDCITISGVIDKDIPLSGVINKDIALSGIIENPIILSGVIDKDIALAGVIDKDIVLSGTANLPVNLLTNGGMTTWDNGDYFEEPAINSELATDWYAAYGSMNEIEHANGGMRFWGLGSGVGWGIWQNVILNPFQFENTDMYYSVELDISSAALLYFVLRIATNNGVLSTNLVTNIVNVTGTGEYQKLDTTITVPDMAIYTPPYDETSWLRAQILIIPQGSTVATIRNVLLTTGC